MPGTFTAEQVLSGSYGKLVLAGVELANVQSVEATVTINRRDIRLAGSRNTQYKAMGVEGSGTFSIFRVTSEFMDWAIEAMSRVSANLVNPLANLSGLNMAITQEDPEIVGGQKETLWLDRVKIWSIPIGFNVDDLIQQSIEFTFESMRESKLILPTLSQTL